LAAAPSACGELSRDLLARNEFREREFTQTPQSPFRDCPESLRYRSA